MDVTKMLSELREERAQLEEAIMTLERLAQGTGRRRGRPPLWLVEARKRTPKIVPSSKAKAVGGSKSE